MKGPLVKVQIGARRWVKMYEADAIAKGYLPAKARPQAENKMRQPAADKGPADKGPQAVETKPAPAVEPVQDDFRVISGVGKSTVEALHERGIYTFDQLMESELDFLPGKVRQAIEAYFGG
jgi:predicted flap endonuclease-1-like 5' DNA nuclease